MSKWEYDTREWEDFVDFVLGLAWVMLFIFVGSGLALFVLYQLGILVG